MVWHKLDPAWPFRVCLPDAIGLQPLTATKIAKFGCHIYIFNKAIAYFTRAK